MQCIPAFQFDADALDAIARNHAQAFRQAQPFPHLVLSDVLPGEILDLLVKEFPDVDDIAWKNYGPGRTEPLKNKKLNKLGQSDERCFGPFTRYFMGQLLSHTFVRFLESVTGHKGLIVDPTHNGCGLHSTGRGGRLMIHTDVNRHPHSRHHLHQVLNLIFYLNKDWKDEYGGHLELWDRERRPVKKIAPIANRMVLFQTGTRSFHGHPEPLTCPPGRRRNSLAVYYYSYERLPEDDYTGMQKSVHWVPSTQADRERRDQAMAYARGDLEELAGKAVRIAAKALPFTPPGTMMGPDRLLFMRLVHWRGLPQSQRRQVRAMHLQKGIDSEYRGHAKAFFQNYTPMAFFGLDRDSLPTDENVLLALLSRKDAGVHIVHPETGRPVFYGYAEKILRDARRIIEARRHPRKLRDKMS